MRHFLETLGDTVALVVGVVGLSAWLVIADAFLNP